MKLGAYIVELGEESTTLELDALIPIDVNILSDEFTNQAAVYAYVAMLAARSEAQYLDAKRELETTFADMYKDVRKDLASSPERVTEAMVSAEIKSRQGYYDAQIYELDCKEQHSIMQVNVKALEMRAQMLISLGAHLRAEAQQTGMSIATETKAKIKKVQQETSEDRNSVRKARQRKRSNDPPFS